MSDKSLEILRNFFSMLFSDTNGFVEIRPVNLQGRVHDILFSRDLDELAHHCFQLRYKSNVYFGVTTRKEKGSGKKENVYELTTLWADMDLKDFNDEKDLKHKVKAFPHEPSIIIHSGGGYHLYWLLKEPHIVEDIQKVEGYTKGVAQFLKADACWDLSHILRSPCTINHPDAKKRRHGRVQTLVRMIHCSARRYSLSEFDDFWTQIQSPKLAQIDLEGIPQELPERFLDLCKKNQKVRGTWEGTRKDLKDTSRSGFDMAMASLLALHDFDEQEIAAVLMKMPAGKNADATERYLQRTIGKAFGSKLANSRT